MWAWTGLLNTHYTTTFNTYQFVRQQGDGRHVEQPDRRLCVLVCWNLTVDF